MTVAEPFNMSCISVHTRKLSFYIYCTRNNILSGHIQALHGNYISYSSSGGPHLLNFHEEPILGKFSFNLVMVHYHRMQHSSV